jgi:hypothetical protein
MSLDDSGNMILAGTLTASGTPLVAARTVSGNRVVSYSSRVSVPTIEDVGEGQMVGGRAYIPIDRAFSDVMDKRAAYLVFITPQGPSGGLYVTEKSPHGFAVREDGNNHSTLTFDYRIVAKPEDTTAPRLPAWRNPMRAFHRIKIEKRPAVWSHGRAPSVVPWLSLSSP